MEAVILIGVQASGKSTFAMERFWGTHVRISLDMLGTRPRERRLLEACLETGQRFIVDNTNPERGDRARYLLPARAAGFRCVGYYFQSRVADCLARNEARPATARVPAAGVLGAAGRLELPSLAEGFEELRYVRIGPAGFVVEEWQHEVR